MKVLNLDHPQVIYDILFYPVNSFISYYSQYFGFGEEYLEITWWEYRNNLPPTIKFKERKKIHEYNSVERNELEEEIIFGDRIIDEGEIKKRKAEKILIKLVKSTKRDKIIALLDSNFTKEEVPLYIDVDLSYLNEVIKFKEQNGRD